MRREAYLRLFSKLLPQPKQMAGLWMTLVLVFLLSGGSAAVDQNQLARLIKGLKNEYQISGMFCLVLSIPNMDPVTLDQIFTDNPKNTVKQKVSQGYVYKGTRLAVAAVKKPEHAEYRVLKDLRLQSNAGDLLVIYSYASSCPTTCTNRKNPYNIITLISNVISSGNWGRRAFVFEKIFKPQDSSGIDERVLEKAIRELRASGIGLANIFRCFKPKEAKTAFQCTSCSQGGEVATDCVDYNAK